MDTRWSLGLALFLTLAGCVNATNGGGGGRGGDAGDAGGVSDAAADTTNPDLCGGLACAANTKCVQGPAGEACRCKEGYTGDPYTKCEEKVRKDCMSSDDCPLGSRCIDDSCHGDPLWELRGDMTYKRIPTPDPKGRTKKQVCEIFEKLDAELTTDMWEEKPQEECEPGRLKPEVQREAILYTNVYRWLIGLDPVTTKKEYLEKTQACSTALAAEGKGLTHTIPMSYTCYSEAAAQGAFSSNIASGARHPATTVPRYIRDIGNPKLGHRRWIFAPQVGATGFGLRGGYSCMYAFDKSGTDDQTEVLYPAPGPFPIGAIHGPWTFMSTDLKTTNGTVEIVEVESGEKLDVQNVEDPGGRYGRLNTLKWTPRGVETNVEYEIRVSNLGARGDVTKTYKTTLVDCDGGR